MTTFRRTRFTWYAYSLWMFFGFFINVLGPITPFLKDELGLSYTVSSLHFSAFAAGTLLAGVIGPPLVRRLGTWPALWVGTWGISLSVGALLLGSTPVVTVGATGALGMLGGLIFITVPALFSAHYGDQRAIALTESNLLGSVVGMTAPLLVGWAMQTWGEWRLALAAVTLAPLGLYAAFRTVNVPTPPAPAEAASATHLPGAFWWYWGAIFLSVAMEFCMLSWSADYVRTMYAVSSAEAAQAVSLFLAGMIGGRWASSVLVRRWPARTLVYASLLVTGAGFGLFWLSGQVMATLAGLFIAGLGVAGLYPLILALALGHARDVAYASARASLASGSAILVLPLVLGWLADAAGIQAAYGAVWALVAGALLMVWLAGHSAHPVHP